MIYDGFKIAATPFICDAYCKCGSRLIEVTNGLLSTAMYCPKCENVYALKLVKVPSKRVGDGFLQMCRNKVKNKKE
jgi:hypothetical protein